MKLTLSEPKYLKESINIISELVSETRFKFNSTGITVISMDPANVAMVIFKLLSSTFAEYDLKETLEIGLNLNNLKQILRRVEASDVVTLETDDKAAKLTITIKGQTTRKFAIPIIESDGKEQREPSLEFPVEVQMKTSLLNSAIEDADVVADAVTIIADSEKIIFAATGDLNNVDVEIQNSDSAKITNNNGGTVKAKYSIEYLKKMISGSKIAEEVNLKFGKDYPIKLTFVSVDKLSLGFILAPRVEGD